VKYALFLPPLGELADPVAFVRVGVAAEQSGWDGVFIWDHVLRPPPEPLEIADPWIMMAALAVATTRIRIGPMVTPITRRRPIKLAREAITLDHLSGGRLTLGLGLGVDTAGELSAFREVVDPRVRGQRLDEGADLLCQLWSGERVDHDGEHFTAAGVTVRPVPVQHPRIPLWFAARGEARRPVRRAARYDGLFPVDVDATSLAEMIDVVRDERGSLDGFDIAVRPSGPDEYHAFAELGATWTLAAPRPGDTDVMAIASGSPTDVFPDDG
jgi:alkanesulfonate monooxygenase SsuD/methylene tetrahydromethanopterin reductase-like flavin-dependent oxidoreductase (luciferase family)